MNDIEARYQDLLRRLVSLAENGIFPQARMAASSILAEHHREFEENENDE